MRKKTVNLDFAKAGDAKSGHTSVQLEADTGKLQFDIGIELPDGRAHTVLKRGRSFPIRHQELFSTASSYQTAMEFHVVYGNRPLAKDCRSLARIRLRNIRWAAAGVPKVAVYFDVNKEGLLTIGIDNLDRKDEAMVETGSVDENHAAKAAEAEAANAAVDEAERERIAELDGARAELRKTDDIYHVAKRAMKWGEKRRYKKARRAISDIAVKPLSQTSEQDMADLKTSMAEFSEVKKLLLEKKRKVESWYE